MSGYCSNCGATDFTPVDGFFYCAVCNTQSQVCICEIKYKRIVIVRTVPS